MVEGGGTGILKQEMLEGHLVDPLELKSRDSIYSYDGAKILGVNVFEQSVKNFLEQTDFYKVYNLLLKDLDSREACRLKKEKAFGKGDTFYRLHRKAENFFMRYCEVCITDRSVVERELTNFLESLKALTGKKVVRKEMHEKLQLMVSTLPSERILKVIPDISEDIEKTYKGQRIRMVKVFASYSDSYKPPLVGARVAEFAYEPIIMSEVKHQVRFLLGHKLGDKDKKKKASKKVKALKKTKNARRKKK